jgi:hypothetical protein
MTKLIITTALGLTLFAIPAAAADRSGTTTGTGTAPHIRCDEQRTGYTVGGLRDPRCDAGILSGPGRSRLYDTRPGRPSDPTASPLQSPGGPGGSFPGSSSGGGTGASPGGTSGGSSGSGR